MTAVLIMFTIQCVLGAFDNLWHHELHADLPHQPTARVELALHTARELLYALIFGSVAWFRWEGTWTLLLVAILGAEVFITIWDFVEEDRSRRLPAFERVLHTILALNYGALLALWSGESRIWAQAPTGFAPADYGVWSTALTVFSIGALAWGLRDLVAVSRLAVPEWQRHPIRAGSKANPRVVLITGATGFIGSALVRRLVEHGDHVIALSRYVPKARDRFGPLIEVVSTLHEIDPARRIDAIVNLAGEPLVGGLWTKRRKQRFIDSRIGVTHEVVALIQRLHSVPSALVSASAIGWYGERGDEVLTEASSRGNGFLSELCQRWEGAATEAARPELRICFLRIGLVLGRDGGVLKPLALATRFGGGMVLGSGRQWQSWIHLGDLVRLFEHALSEPTMAGPINAVSNQSVTQREFTKALGKVLRRPVPLRMPEFMLRHFVGDMSELFLISQRVAPVRAPISGFQFRWPELQSALTHLLLREVIGGKATAVYVNQECPVCKTEMGHYERAVKSAGSNVEFRAIANSSGGLPAYGLTERDLQRRLFVESANGRLFSGVDGMLQLWRTLPGAYPRLAGLIETPIIHGMCELFYDLIIAPLLSSWSERRIRRLKPTLTSELPS